MRKLLCFTTCLKAGRRIRGLTHCSKELRGVGMYTPMQCQLHVTVVSGHRLSLQCIQGVPGVHSCISGCQGGVGVSLNKLSHSAAGFCLPVFPLSPSPRGHLYYWHRRGGICCISSSQELCHAVSCHVILIALNIGLQIHSVCLASLISKCKLTYKQMKQDPWIYWDSVH